MKEVGKDDGLSVKRPVLKIAKFQFANSTPFSNKDLCENNESKHEDKI